MRLSTRSLMLIVMLVMSMFTVTACTTTNDSYQLATLQEGRKSFLARDYNKAYRQLLPLAAKGNADAQYAIGYMYYYGKGVDRNQQLAQHWMRKAAKQGQPDAIKAMAAIKKSG